jgi:Flp pilus assembly protein TadD
LKEAQSACRKWIVDNEPPEDAYRFYANVSKALRDKESEEEAYKKYLAHVSQKIANAPTETKYYETRGSIYDKLSEPEKARFDYLDFLEGSDLKNHDGVFYPKKVLKFGRLFERVGKLEKKDALYDTAIWCYNEKLKISPKDARLYSYRAQIYAAQNNTKAASKDFETAGKWKHTISTTRAWAEFALKNKQYAKAMELATELVDDDLSTGLAFEAAVLEAIGDHKSALSHATGALKEDPFLPSAYYWLGRARAGLGQNEEAGRKLQQATALGYDPNASMFEEEEDEEEQEGT